MTQQPAPATGSRHHPQPGPGEGRARTVDDILRAAAASVGVDTAAALVLDRSRGVLEVVGSYGAGLVGHDHPASGFARAVTEARRPVLTTDAARLGVPLLRGHELVGVLDVASGAPRRFDVAAVVELERWAEQVVGALEGRLPLEESDDVAVRRSLLPALGAPVDGWDLAARYVPADGDLGGDWYDVFPLPGGRLGLVIGDVEGHGSQSAVVMGRLRSALRACALADPDPGEVLTRLDRHLSHFENGTCATVLFAVSSAPYETLTISSAGHWSPLLAAPGRAPALLEVRHDVMLGTGLALRRSSTEVPLPVGAALCLYTDGLVERRPTPGSDPATQLATRLDRALAGLDPDDDAQTNCTRILLDALGGEPVEDDTTLLVVQRPLPGHGARSADGPAVLR